MGMPTAFTGDADFSGMTGTRELYIDLVIHQAFIEVNEQGTEAAAATGVSMRLTAAPAGEVFRADRPFVFLIRDVETGLVMFMGRVSDPS
jgi:serpin B